MQIYEEDKYGRFDYFWLLGLQMIFIFSFIYALTFFCNECLFYNKF